MKTYIVTYRTSNEFGHDVFVKKTVIAPDELTAMARGGTGEVFDIQEWSDEGEDFGHCPYANIPVEDDNSKRPFKTEDF